VEVAEPAPDAVVAFAVDLEMLAWFPLSVCSAWAGVRRDGVTDGMGDGINESDGIKGGTAIVIELLRLNGAVIVTSVLVKLTTHRRPQRSLELFLRVLPREHVIGSGNVMVKFRIRYGILIPLRSMVVEFSQLGHRLVVVRSYCTRCAAAFSRFCIISYDYNSNDA
jgi:hypothetical protein